jgi:predicted protein tyrosine phosphatase
MSCLIVTPYSAVKEVVRRRRPSHLLSLMDLVVETPASISPDRHLRIHIHDISEPMEGAIAPDPAHIQEMLSFAETWDRSAPFLVHCWAGISRSTAAAFILLNQIHGQGREYDIAQTLRFYAPHAQPNRLMIRHADKLMNREGRMIGAVDEMGLASGLEGEIVELPLTLEDL